ncbi:MAG: integrase [Pseudohongiellaceae bacterium]|jgi:integrase
MANIRTRPETGKLFIDFRIHGTRYREQTLLEDNPKNRKQLEAFTQRMEAKILLGDFNYAEFFPNSPNIAKFSGAVSRINSVTVNAATKVDYPKFEAFARQWQTEKKIEWRASHARNIESVLSNSLIKFFGKRVLSDITKAEILEFRSKLASKPGRGGKEQIAAKTINTHMALLKAILEEASDRYSFENPYKNIKPLKLQRSHVEPFSLIEVNRIIESVREDYRNYYSVRFYSGMRTGEIDGLRWEFVDFKRGLIAIRETLVQGKTEYTKTDGSQRDIPMLGPVKAALEAQYQATSKLSPYVFCNTEGKPLDHNNITKRVWYPLLRHLGLKMRRPYQTRHTAATLLLASGENPEWVARFLGHASTEMLFKVYSRYIPNLTRQDGSAFEQMLGVQDERHAAQ